MTSWASNQGRTNQNPNDWPCPALQSGQSIFSLGKAQLCSDSLHYIYGMASAVNTRQLPLMKDIAFPLANGLFMRVFHTKEGTQLTLFRVNIKGRKYNVCTFNEETWQFIVDKQDVINSCIELVTPTA